MWGNLTPVDFRLSVHFLFVKVDLVRYTPNALRTVSCANGNQNVANDANIVVEFIGLTQVLIFNYVPDVF